MKCKQCKKELTIDIKNSDLINGVLFVMCPKCGNDNSDTEITNKVTLERLYWSNKQKKRSGNV